jgi:hypothetical protein
LVPPVTQAIPAGVINPQQPQIASNQQPPSNIGPIQQNLNLPIVPNQNPGPANANLSSQSNSQNHAPQNPNNGMSMEPTHNNLFINRHDFNAGAGGAQKKHL